MGGPIALVEGDIISINIPENRLDVKVSDEEMQKRRAKWQPRQPQVTSGYLDRYRKMVTSANRGAILEINKKMPKAAVREICMLPAAARRKR
ncbi:MAG: dihydroxy-acid dehydratase [Eisenbergiella massiliensis]